MAPYTRIWLRDADAAQSRVFLPANKPASKHRANVQGVRIVQARRGSLIIQMELFRSRGIRKTDISSKNIINAIVVLKETLRSPSLTKFTAKAANRCVFL